MKTLIKYLVAASQDTGHADRIQPPNVGYTAKAHQGITGERYRTQERGIKAYHFVEQGIEMVSTNQGYAQSRKVMPRRRFQSRTDGGTDDGQAH